MHKPLILKIIGGPGGPNTFAKYQYVSRMVSQIFSRIVPFAVANLIMISQAYSATLVTLDGDTFVLDGETVRIANIDAPETRQAKCDAEKRLGHVAAARLDRLLHSGPITLSRGDPVDGRKKDRHGRTLAVVTVAGKDVGEILIAEELARTWQGKRQAWCQ